jgi:ABC-type nitrate/sulfonate/bicarbonate transport system substrate-binding protein
MPIRTTARTGLMVFGFAGLLIAHSALAQTPKPAAPPKLLDVTLINTTPGMPNSPAVGMKMIGEEYGIKLNVIDAQGGGQAGQVFAGGSGDILLVGIDTPALFVVQKLLDVKVVGSLITTMGWSAFVPKDSPLKTLADLKGHSIGISGPGALSELALLWGLNKEKIDPATVNRISISSVTAMSAALDNHKLDAEMLPHPLGTMAIEAGTARAIGDWRNVPYPNDVFVVRTKDLQAKRAEYVRIMQLAQETLHRMEKDQAFGIKVLRTRAPVNMTDEELKGVLKAMLYGAWAPRDGIMTSAGYKNAADIWVEAGRFKADQIPPYSSLVENLLPAKAGSTK